MDWQLLLMVLGLALILEGVPYFLSPSGALKTLRQLEQAGPWTVRMLGLGAMVVGVVLLLLGRYGGS
jgi:uncharacterized protein YjeT (DUF2065 family)